METIARPDAVGTFGSMEAPRPELVDALRRIALLLGACDDAGGERGSLLRQLAQRLDDSVRADVVEDIVVAAGQALAGVDPRLPMLVGVWGDEPLERAAARVGASLADMLRRR